MQPQAAQDMANLLLDLFLFDCSMFITYVALTFAKMRAFGGIILVLFVCGVIGTIIVAVLKLFYYG